MTRNQSTCLKPVRGLLRQSFNAFEDDKERGEDHHEGHEGNDDGVHH